MARARKSARTAELSAGLCEAERFELELLAVDDLSASHQRSIAVAGARCWRLRALLHHEGHEYDAARKASSTADELAKLAAKLERAGLVDRVAELERLVLEQGLAGSRLQALARSRRR